MRHLIIRGLSQVLKDLATNPTGAFSVCIFKKFFFVPGKATSDLLNRVESIHLNSLI